MKTPASPRARQRGFSFFEVLIAALVLAIGVLGFAGLQVRALDSTGVAHFRAQATVLAGELAERIRMAEVGLAVDASDYRLDDLWGDALEVPETPPASWTRGDDTCIGNALAGALCDEADLVRADVLEIRYMARELLPAGTVSVRECTAGSELTCVFVAWRGTNAADCDIDTPEDNCVAAQVYF